MKNLKWTHSLYLIPALLLIWGDQALKIYIRATLPMYATRPLFPGLIELTYVQNTGAAFSLFSEHTWILTIISALASLLMIVLILRGVFPHPMAQLALSFVLGGAVGNLIDRALLGYVVDMFSLTFTNFAIFNIADIGVTLGGALLFAYLLLFWNKGEKAEEPRDVQAEIAEAVKRAEDAPEETPDLDAIPEAEQTPDAPEVEEAARAEEAEA